jgi:AraC-like DNA-binding protein
MMNADNEKSDCAKLAAEVLRRIKREVEQRFHRLTDLTAVTVAIPPSNGGNGDPGVASRPRHPNCDRLDGRAACEASWRRHLDHLRSRPERHSHVCQYGNRCELVPIVHRGCCLAACKVVVPATQTVGNVRDKIEMLGVLVENFISREQSLLSDLIAAGDEAPTSESDAPAPWVPKHPFVALALAHIDRNATNPELNVEAVARALDVNASYLAHIFVRESGMRMTRHINNRRIARAKGLLATTSWPIKRIAAESGYRNRAWFSEVFRKMVGQTPGQYRRAAVHRERPGTFPVAVDFDSTL